MQLTTELAWAAAIDAGNRNMREHNRQKWNEDDWNSACEEFYRLLPTDSGDESC